MLQSFDSCSMLIYIGVASKSRHFEILLSYLCSVISSPAQRLRSACKTADEDGAPSSSPFWGVLYNPSRE